MANVGSAYPTRFDFIMCEDVRQEQNKKLTLIGTFVGSKIAVPANTQKAVITLSLLWIFDDGVGTFAEHCEITGPDGFRLLTTSQTAEKLPNGPHVFVMQMKPSPPMSLGKYVARVFLDTKAYERIFEIISDPTVQEGPALGSGHVVPPKLQS